MKIFILGILLFLYFSLHSALANHQVKIFLMQKGITKKYYRLFFNFSALASLIPIFYFYKKIEPILLFVNILLQNIGLGIAAIGVVLLLVALNQYNLAEFAGTQQLKQTTPLPSEALKTSGFNSMVRHPLYFSGLLLIWGSFLLQPTDLFLMVSIISTTYLYFGTKLEEEKLVMEFGKEYEKYQHEVGMLIPFWKFSKK
jgi:protein-S-isoprenylcysteine O-methyltransferase Ste14